eukprot:6007559-Prymnesium_polylepis.1
MNIVFRNGKPRMTINKSMQLVDGVASYNDCVDLDAQPSIEYDARSPCSGVRVRFSSLQASRW